MGEREKETKTGGCGLFCIHCVKEDVTRRIDEKADDRKIWFTHFEKIGDKYICNLNNDKKDVTDQVCKEPKPCFTPDESSVLLSRMCDIMHDIVDNMNKKS